MKQIIKLTAVVLSFQAASASAVPFFTQVLGRLGQTQPCNGTGCYSNYLVLADLDNDQDLDIVFSNGGGFYEPGNDEPMAVYLNDGLGQFTDITTSAIGAYTGRLRQVALGDIDGDSDLDIIAPDAWTLQPDAVFINDGTGHFADEGAARLGTSSRAGSTRLGDLDNDGDLDLVISDWGDAPPFSSGTGSVFTNDGLGNFTLAYTLEDPANEQGTGPIDADLFDADQDFDLDLVFAHRDGESLLFINEGGVLTPVPAQLPDQPGPYVYGPDPCDIDHDGDLDLWLDNGGANLHEQLFINNGAGVFTDESNARIDVNLAADDNEVQCIDVDADGDLDAIVASLSDEERLYLNNNGDFTLVADAFPAVGDSTLGLDLGDIDGDGRLDAVTAQGESGSFLNRVYLGTSNQPLDTIAPRFRAIQTNPPIIGNQVLVRFAVEDRATSDVGPRLNDVHVELQDGTPISATWAGGDLYQSFVTATGSVTLRACATDAANNQGCSDFVTVQGQLPPPPPDPIVEAGCQIDPTQNKTGLSLLLLGALGLLLRRRRD